MQRSQGLSLAVLVMVVLAGFLPPAAAVESADGLGLQQDVDPDVVNLNVAIQSDGDAEWTIEYLVRLETENDTLAFEDLQDDIEANRSDYINRFADRMNSTVTDAESATGREMSATDFTVSTGTESLGEYGILTYTFTWNDFAVVSGDTITAGDALEGFFLDQDTSLQFRWSEELALASANPEPTSTRDQSVVWQGPLDFASGEPRLNLEPAPATTEPTTTTADTTTTSGTPSTEEATPIWIWLLGGILVLAVLAVAWWYWRGEPDGAAPPVEGDAETAPPSDLLSNEERVEQFLESEGGRSKQQEIVEGLGWTEAKTSQVLSEMQESGRIEKFRIGRENVVKLPDTDGESE